MLKDSFDRGVFECLQTAAAEQLPKSRTENLKGTTGASRDSGFCKLFRRGPSIKPCVEIVERGESGVRFRVAGRGIDRNFKRLAGCRDDAPAIGPSSRRVCYDHGVEAELPLETVGNRSGMRPGRVRKRGFVFGQSMSVVVVRPADEPSTSRLKSAFRFIIASWQPVADP